MKLKSQDGQCECKVDDVAYLSVNDDGKTCVRVSADAKMISICKNMIIIFNAEEKFCNTLMEVVKEYLQ